ncbi:unnamed protein product [Ectocarpus sp. 8 AP-2014]
MGKKKVLLMGKSRSGKTSMRSIIFANYGAKDTIRLGPTLDVEHSHVRFLGDMVLNLWDCGGQDSFYETYFNYQQEFIFRSVEVLIYVFDVMSDDVAGDLERYRGVLEAVDRNSSDARVFVLIHKMDLVTEEDREVVFLNRKQVISDVSGGVELTFFMTSIWDETLYKAWSSIVYSLIPNMEVLESHLDNFCDICGADEVVLFERETFLVIAHATQVRHPDVHRFEKISNIVKQFKLSVSKTSLKFEGMMVKNSNFTVFISDFTENTYIMVVTTSPLVEKATTELNIKAAKKHFERLLVKPEDLGHHEMNHHHLQPGQVA